MTASAFWAGALPVEGFYRRQLERPRPRPDPLPLRLVEAATLLLR